MEGLGIDEMVEEQKTKKKYDKRHEYKTESRKEVYWETNKKYCKIFYNKCNFLKKTFTRDQKINIGYTHKQTKGKMKL